MLTRLYVDNFKAFVNFELPIQSLNLLLGTNGSGKSSTFEILRLLQKLIGGCAVSELFSLNTLTRWQGVNVQTFEIDLHGNGGQYRYRLEIEHQPSSRQSHIKHERLLFDEQPLYQFLEGTILWYRDDYSKGAEFDFDWNHSGLTTVLPRHDNTRLTWFKKRMTQIYVLRLNPFAMQSRSELEVTQPAEDLSNFASWYRHLLQEQPAMYATLQQALREAIDGFDTLTLANDGEHARVLKVKFQSQHEETFRFSNKLEFRFDELSEGQQALIILYTLLNYSSENDLTFCLDEPENFLALPEIQPWLLQIADKAEDEPCQVLMISHHPELINYLAASKGYWFERLNGRAVRVHPIKSDHLEETTLGLPVSELVARGWIS
ncbi:MAG: AAA family ATPase [Pseudomonadota bacterium]